MTFFLPLVQVKCILHVIHMCVLSLIFLSNCFCCVLFVLFDLIHIFYDRILMEDC